jgi:hypothetical protein
MTSNSGYKPGRNLQWDDALVGTLAFWNGSLVKVKCIHNDVTQQIAVTWPDQGLSCGYPHISKLRVAVACPKHSDHIRANHCDGKKEMDDVDDDISDELEEALTEEEILVLEKAIRKLRTIGKLSSQQPAH